MKSVKSVRMQLGPRSYSIHIGGGAVESIPKWLANRTSKRAFIVADERLTEARSALRASLSRSGWQVHEIPVRAGEELKDIQSVYPIYGELLRAKASRDSVLLALGGGSVGDAAGFVAATYLRGISWVGIPTTLLAQVDSSIGGKTGINHEAGKNLIGSFHQPCLVVCDTDFLKTLGKREIISGLGEVFKYGITFDPKLFSYLKEHALDFMALDADVLSTAIHKSAQWKCKAVAKDEFDRKGVREVLNFGHTFGHALEGITRYEIFQHGEAVIWGMRFALALSQARKKLAAKERRAIDDVLAQLEVPAIPSGFGASDLFSFMEQDKKVRNGKIHFVLVNRLGKTVSDNGVTEGNLHAAYRLLDLEDGARPGGAIP
jgi:3-dehydroquinate synthase